jgi:phosphate transport system substrate-binding protein
MRESNSMPKIWDSATIRRPPWVAGLVVVLLTACAAQPLTVTPQPTALRIAAPDSCAALIEELAFSYQASRPWVTVQVETLEAAVARERLLSGADDLAVLSWLGDDPARLWSTPLAADAIAVIAHPAAPVANLSIAELGEIFQGRRGEWDDGTPIQVVSREGGAGIRAAFEALVMEGNAVTTAALVAPDNEGVLEAVVATPGAIGYVSAASDRNQVHTLTIEGIMLTQPDYPLTTTLYLAASAEPGGESEALVHWLLAAGQQERIARYFTPLP